MIESNLFFKKNVIRFFQAFLSSFKCLEGEEGWYE